jgi:hypothetical protein
MADPGGHRLVKARDGIINADLESAACAGHRRRRSPRPDARAEGFGEVRPAPGADGLAGVRRLRHQDPVNPTRSGTAATCPKADILNVLRCKK